MCRRNFGQMWTYGSRENIKPGNAELKRKGVKHATVQIYCVWCLSIRVNVSRDLTHSTSTRMFDE
jgi:hypothetical protein